MRTVRVDDNAFAELIESHRPELRVHCYRMLGSFDEAEDLVQETLLRAWRGRGGFGGRSTVRTWLYRIATNACLDELERTRRRPRVDTTGPPPADRRSAVPSSHIEWLQPFPDHVLDETADPSGQPEAATIARETIELAFLAAIQHLAPRQRAVLILRDVLAWSAIQTAEALDLTVPAVKSALQRARAGLRAHLPASRAEWAPTDPPTPQESRLVRRFMEAHERADMTLLAALLSDDVRLSMPPHPFRFVGPRAVLDFAEEAFAPGSALHGGRWRCVPTRANRQPAVAGYLRVPGQREFHAQVLDVLQTERGTISEITAFEPTVFRHFGLPPTLP